MNLFSRYRPGYFKTLVYMLQANIYDIKPYLEWIGRTRDFTQVMKRKKLVMTTKAKLLLLWLYLLNTAAWGFGISLLIGAMNDAILWVKLGLLIILTPIVLPYLLVVPLVLGTVLIQRPREKRIVASAKAKLANHPGTKIAVAGSFGKTTMKEILSTVLAEGKKVAATPGNMNTPLGISTFINRLDGSEEVLIFELGEYYPGDIRDLCDLVQPDMGVITGINEAHLMRFKTLERTVATIYELADYLGDKPLWVNGESELAAKALRPGNRSYTRKGVGELKVQHPATNLKGVNFKVVGGGSKLTIHSNLLGLHNIGPLMVGVDVAGELGLTPKQIEAGLAKTRPFEHRMQPAEHNGIVTIDDSYNGNPDGARVAIEFLKDLKGHRRIYVTPGIVEIGSATTAVHQRIGVQLASSVDVVVLVRNSATPHIAAGLESAHFKGQVIWYEDGLSCLHALPQITKSGDVVLLQNDWADNYA